MRPAPMLSRRLFLTRSAALGCSAAASPLMTSVSFAAAPWEARLVVILLRGGMDGLDAVRPYGAPEFAAARPRLAGDLPGEGLDLDGFFALHPALGDLMPLWRAGDLGFAHAVATPYRNKRSHFGGQDLLEAGTPSLAGIRDGWLNRMLQAVPGATGDTAYAVGRDNPLLLRGAAEVRHWSPGTSLALSPQARRLMERVSHDDPLFRDALAEALTLTEAQALAEKDGGAGMMEAMAADRRDAQAGKGHVALARFAAERLTGEARVAAFSLNGWDTHRNQTRGLAQGLARLSETILALRDGLGPLWGQTAVLAMTEFGRTLRENGTQGTDHGTGGALVMAGGAIRGGRVYGDWPGLAEADLFDRRDLLPTADVRAYAARAMQGLFGLDRAVLEGAVFPGLDLSEAPRDIIQTG